MSYTTETPNALIEITAKELPLHCPTEQVALWSSHPRVFLDVVKTGSVACPYCGTKYKLKDGEVLNHHH
ncbi:MAG: zinc-finger domain-containing protein [Methylotenera sp.]|nr:zinc-finger domain-containing protein [Methylotenera sp.]